MDSLVIFFDLKAKNVNGDERTLDYQKRCDVYKDEGKIVRIYARTKFGEKIFEKGISLPSEFLAFLQWLKSIRKRGQKLILVAHNNQFFHFHILKKHLTAFGTPLPDFIYFFDSMTLMEKIPLLGRFLL